MLKYDEHQASVIASQDKFIEAQAVAIAVLEERIATLMQRVQQRETWNKPCY